jgi:hypothetical protein
VRTCGRIVALWLACAVPAVAGQPPDQDPARTGAAAAVAAGERVIDGSPAPVAPSTITRDAQRRPTVRAIKLT